MEQPFEPRHINIQTVLKVHNFYQFTHTHLFILFLLFSVYQRACSVSSYPTHGLCFNNIYQGLCACMFVYFKSGTVMKTLLKTKVPPPSPPSLPPFIHHIFDIKRYRHNHAVGNSFLTRHPIVTSYPVLQPQLRIVHILATYKKRWNSDLRNIS